jgi:hypothetical protein
MNALIEMEVLYDQTMHKSYLEWIGDRAVHTTEFLIWLADQRPPMRTDTPEEEGTYIVYCAGWHTGAVDFFKNGEWHVFHKDDILKWMGPLPPIEED